MTLWLSCHWHDGSAFLDFASSGGGRVCLGDGAFTCICIGEAGLSCTWIERRQW